MIGTLAAGIGAWKRSTAIRLSLRAKRDEPQAIHLSASSGPLKNLRRHERSARGAERFLRRLAADSFRRQTLEDG
jgi:hypothetical protein